MNVVLGGKATLDYLFGSGSRMQTSDGVKRLVTRSLQVRRGEFIMRQAGIQVSLRTGTIHQVDCACKPVTCCLSVTKPVKGEIIIPAGWFPEAPVAPGPLAAAWLFDGHLNYSGSWLIMGQPPATLPRPAFVLPPPPPWSENERASPADFLHRRSPSVWPVSERKQFIFLANYALCIRNSSH